MAQKIKATVKDMEHAAAVLSQSFMKVEAKLIQKLKLDDSLSTLNQALKRLDLRSSPHGRMGRRPVMLP